MPNIEVSRAAGADNSVNQAILSIRRGRHCGLTCGVALLLTAWGLTTSLGCTAVINGRDAPSAGAGPLGAAGNLGNAGTSGAVSGSGSGGTGATPACADSLSIPTRLARIGDAQIANAIQDVFGSDVLSAVTVADPATRDFIAIQDSLSSAVLDRYVQTAEAAMNAVTDQTLTKLGGCTTATFDDACAKNAIAVAAQKFYRRPITADETASLITVYTVTSQYGIPAATRATLSAILTAPPTLYRTELGSAAQNGTTSLTSYEVASELSFMLADTIPDDGLLAAAKADKLKSADDIRTEVNRLLGTPLVQANLTRVMLANYSVGSLFGSAKDAQLFPAYTPALETSLYTETKMFVDNVLWHGKITDLLTSRQTFIDENLAALYNVTYPAAPGGGFQPYTFAANDRAGLLTQGSILAIAANPDNTSVVPVRARQNHVFGGEPTARELAVSDQRAQHREHHRKSQSRFSSHDRALQRLPSVVRPIRADDGTLRCHRPLSRKLP
jgi:hypothetical protein